MSTNETPRCEAAPICDRGFAPTKTGNQCIRCGHADPCHETGRLQDGRSVIGPRICFWKRDDKTIATCREKFDNFGQYAFPGEPHVPSEESDEEWPLIDEPCKYVKCLFCDETLDHTNPACPTLHNGHRIPRISPRDTQETDKHWRTTLVGLLPKRDASSPVHRLGCSIFRTSTCNCIGATNKHVLNLGESSQPSLPIVYGRPPSIEETPAYLVPPTFSERGKWQIVDEPVEVDFVPEQGREAIYARPPAERRRLRDFPHMGYLGATLEAWCSRQAEMRTERHGKVTISYSPEGLEPAVLEMRKWFDGLLVGNLRARKPRR